MDRSGEFKKGWPVVGAAALGIGLGISPIPFYTIDVMVAPLGKEFGWTPADVFIAIAVYTVCSLFTAPVIGMLADRFGARRVTLISLVTFSLSMMALSLNTGSTALYIGLWVLVAIAGAGTLPVVITRPINTWFDRRRGLALGVALITTGVFGALAKAFAQSLVDLYGWRTAYVGLGLLPLTIAMPIALLCLRDTDDTPYAEAGIARARSLLTLISLIGGGCLVYFAFQFFWPLFVADGWKLQFGMAFAFMIMVIGLLLAAQFVPVRMEPPPATLGKATSTLSGLTISEALKTWRFWLLAICFVPISYAIGAMIPSIVPLLGEKGFGTAEAVSLATLTGLAVFLGRLIGGYLIDRFWAPGIAFVFLASPAAALLLLTGDVSQGSATLAILMIGFGAGVEYDFLAYLVSKYFGMRSYSAVYGALYAFFAAGAGFGPKLINDTAQAYGWDFALQTAAAALFISTLPLLALGRYRDFTGPPTDVSEPVSSAG